MDFSKYITDSYEAYFNGDYEKALKLVLSAEEEFERIEAEEEVVAKILIQKALIFSSLQNNLSAFEAFAKAESVYANSSVLSEKNEYLDLLESAAYSALRVEKILEAKDYLNRQIKLINKEYVQGAARCAESHILLARIYETESDIDCASKEYTKAENILNEIGENKSDIFVRVLTGKGDCALSNKNPSEALTYYEKAKALLEGNEVKDEVYADVLSSMGLLYLFEKKANNAVNCFMEAKEFFDENELNESLGYARLMNNIGYFFECTGKTDEALKAYTASVAAYTKIGFTPNAKQVYAKIATLAGTN